MIMGKKSERLGDAKKGWNHHPPFPLKRPSILVTAPKPHIVAIWLIENFLRSSDHAVYIAYSILIAVWLMPFSLSI